MGAELNNCLGPPQLEPSSSSLHVHRPREEPYRTKAGYGHICRKERNNGAKGRREWRGRESPTSAYYLSASRAQAPPCFITRGWEQHRTRAGPKGPKDGMIGRESLLKRHNVRANPKQRRKLRGMTPRKQILYCSSLAPAGDIKRISGDPRDDED